ncbi:MAG: class I SAM-dependent methyltransferase [Chloroflexia bacterium]|nr:class I SAM-dependent methyltransferase [Chloroflexia bacterium]
MDLATFSWLLTSTGQAVLAELTPRLTGEATVLPELERLRRLCTPEQARAAVETVQLRQRARAKFPQAARLYFTREALEQASAGSVAAHRATRLASYRQVADLCCGIGGDALALAAVGAMVTAVDHDPLRVAMCQANAEALGFGFKVAAQVADLLAEPPPYAEALFCDPGRRRGDRRLKDVEAYEPPLDHVLGWQTVTPALAIKLAPGVPHEALPGDAEVELVSLDGELKETMLWCGPLVSTRRRATVLHHLDATGGYQVATRSTEHPSPPPGHRLTSPATWLYEPDPAIIRAGMVTDLAVELDAAQLDPQIAYLTAPVHMPTPLARAWRIVTWLPFQLKALRARLRTLDAGEVTVKKRGSPLDTDQLARQLRGPGQRALVVVLTRVAGRPAAIICDPLQV